MSIEIRAAEELAEFHLVSVDEAVKLIAWSQEHFTDEWETVAGAMAELADEGIPVDKLFKFGRTQFVNQCVFLGVWLPGEIIAANPIDLMTMPKTMFVGKYKAVIDG